MRGTILEPMAIQAGLKVPSAAITRPDNTTAYTANDVVSTTSTQNITFSDVSYIQGNHIMLMDATLRIDLTAVPSGMIGFKLYLYDSAPTAIADNAAYDWIAADKSKLLTYITFSVPEKVGSTGILWTELNGINRRLKLASSSNTLYGVLQTLGGYTPASETVHTITLGFAQL